MEEIEMKRRYEKAKRIGDAIKELRCPTHNELIKPPILVSMDFYLNCGDICCNEFRELIDWRLVELAAED
ncbi:MAG: hypothetical protein ABIQ40_16190 [Bacteroidia bacterium]